MNVLVPVEDYYFGTLIASFIAQHQWPKDINFRVVSIIEPYLLDNSSMVTFAKFLEATDQQIIGEAQILVKRVANAIRLALPKAQVNESAVQSHVKDQIVSLAKSWPADLIVLGSH